MDRNALIPLPSLKKNKKQNNSNKPFLQVRMLDPSTGALVLALACTQFGLLRTHVCASQLSCHDNIPYTGRRKQRKLNSHNSGGWQSKVKVGVNPVPGENSPPGLWVTTVSLGPHTAESPVVTSLMRTLIPSWRPYPHGLIQP